MKQPKISIGLRFKQAWKNCLEPRIYKVVDINEDTNEITVESKRLGEQTSRYNPIKIEIWPDLDRLHLYFELGDYIEV